MTTSNAGMTEARCACVRAAAQGLAFAIGLPLDTVFSPISRQLYDRIRAESGDDWSAPVQMRLPELYEDCLVDPQFRYFNQEATE
jgi:hypothetical protein